MLSPNTAQDFQIIIASTNGSGSLTANRLLHKALFREGYHVVGKNLFPSNIEGLPTYYVLRLSQNYNSIRPTSDLYVGLNPNTFTQDLKDFVSADGSFIFYNEDLKQNPSADWSTFGLSFRKFGQDLKAPIKIKKRVANLYYVGWVAAVLDLNPETFKALIYETFSKESVCEMNFTAFKKAYDWAKQEHGPKTNALTESLKPLQGISPSKDQIFIEGNQAAALGWVDAGCTVATWYPITPSSSLVESFEAYVEKLRPKQKDQKNNFAVVQAEDEISAVCAVVGASWAGARAATATSGPGLSLMNEAIGLAYFAEVPTVVWDIQRVGPSTGLPTRTSQGDLLSAYYNSHGDSFHPVLLPSTANECYEMAFTAFDVSEVYQTPVFVLSDLDLGMNAWVGSTLKPYEKALKRGAVLSEIDLENTPDFKRYLGDDKGIPSRTLPGTHHPLGSYMTRGSAHNIDASYSEDPEVFTEKLLRLKKKVLNARADLPKPEITQAVHKTSKAIIYYGTTGQIFPEVLDLLPSSDFDLCRVKSLPLHDEVFEFINHYEQVFVIEQNRDGQLLNLIKSSSGIALKPHLVGVHTFGGWPIAAETVATKLQRFFDQPFLNSQESQL